MTPSVVSCQFTMMHQQHCACHPLSSGAASSHTPKITSSPFPPEFRRHHSPGLMKHEGDDVVRREDLMHYSHGDGHHYHAGHAGMSTNREDSSSKVCSTTNLVSLFFFFFFLFFIFTLLCCIFFEFFLKKRLFLQRMSFGIYSNSFSVCWIATHYAT